PMTVDQESVTRLLQAWSAGDKEALSKVIELLYKELKELANYQLNAQGKYQYYSPRSKHLHTLSPTILVHETYLKLIGNQPDISWKSRQQFLAIIGHIMRQVTIDYIRRRLARKRDSKTDLIDLIGNKDFFGEKKVLDILAVDEALRKL